MWNAEPYMKRITIADFRDYARDRFIDAQTGPEASLAPTVLLTNGMGVTNRVCEELTADRWCRVVFDLPSANVKGAELLFYVLSDTTTQQQPMRLIVNGHRLTHRQDRKRMLTGGWDRKRISARYLVEGRNEFIFAGSGVLYVDPSAQGASSRSFNRGETWHTDALGPERINAVGVNGRACPRAVLVTVTINIRRRIFIQPVKVAGLRIQALHYLTVPHPVKIDKPAALNRRS